MDIFRCACEGGVRYSSRTNTVVLVVNNTKKGLPNKFVNGILEFAGKPLKENGALAGSNRRLAQSLAEKGDIFLFEVNQPGKYEFKGKIMAAGKPDVRAIADGVRYPVFRLEIEPA